MQFRLSKLFGITALAGMLTLAARMVYDHWDVRSYYAGFYGRGDIPRWATGSGADSTAEAAGSLLSAVWHFGPWIGVFGIACLIGAWSIQLKGSTK